MRLSILPIAILALILPTLFFGCGSVSSSVVEKGQDAQVMPQTSSTAKLTNGYGNKALGLSFEFPADFVVTPQGPNLAEEDYRSTGMISGTVVPMTETLMVAGKDGIPALFIAFPDTKAYPVVDKNGSWDRRACGAEGFAKISEETTTTVSGFPALSLASDYVTGGSAASRYLCVNYPAHPLIIAYENNPIVAAQAQAILATFKLAR